MTRVGGLKGDGLNRVGWLKGDAAKVTRVGGLKGDDSKVTRVGGLKGDDVTRVGGLKGDDSKVTSVGWLKGDAAKVTRVGGLLCANNFFFLSPNSTSCFPASKGASAQPAVSTKHPMNSVKKIILLASGVYIY